VQNDFLAALIWLPIFVFEAATAGIPMAFSSALIEHEKCGEKAGHVNEHKKYANGCKNAKRPQRW